MAFNNGPKLVTQGLNLLVDAGDPTSYPGTGTTWRDVVGGQNGIITGSVSYTSSFYGGLVFSGPTASVIFPTSSANFGTGSFTVELAFRPAQINGIHYLVSKNSGSFPSWGIYLSGSGGQGKLFSEFRINTSVSCSVSSSTTFVTGSNYFVDAVFSPADTITNLTVNINYNFDSIFRANGTGSLISTGSLLIGNIASSSSQAYSGSIFSTKIYNTSVNGFQNYKSQYTRFGNVLPSRPSFVEALIVAGGGGGGTLAGGGAGGLRYVIAPVVGGSNPVFVGDGGAGATSNTVSGSSGQTSSFAGFVAAGGGFGGNFPSGNGGSGGSGGGGGTGGVSGSGNTPATIPSQGNNGGGASSAGAGSGGGGAGQTGSSAIAMGNGNGGSGSFYPQFAAAGGSPSGWFAGGGAGAVSSEQYYGGIGGGGAGAGTVFSGQPGTANTGGGGGANYGNSGRKGGSGVVIIRYPSSFLLASGGTITTIENFTYHTFTATGSSSFTIF